MTGHAGILGILAVAVTVGFFAGVAFMAVFG